jgi:hypothetical protein
MAQQKYGNFLTASANPAFDQLYHPGTATRYSGVYRCTKRAHEITHVAGRALPPQNHPAHTAAQGAILWQLAVAHGVIR